MLLYVYANIGVPDFAVKAAEAAKVLSKNGFTCAANPKKAAYFKGTNVRFDIPASECDYVTAVGGDGTMLHAAAIAVEHDKPFFGINAGRVGYLSAFDFKEIGDVTPETIKKLHASRRTLLDVYIDSTQTLRALNDVYISKKDPARTVELFVKYGTHEIAKWKADGIIVSTATGSTAYSLSAGGPVVSPELDVMIVTPVCPASGFNRALILDGRDEITFSPTERNGNDAVISVDGATIGTIVSGSVSLKVSDRTLTLLTSERRNFYSTYYSNNLERDLHNEG